MKLPDTLVKALQDGDITPDECESWIDGMTFESYQLEALKTVGFKDEDAVNYLLHGIAAEVGELAGHWAKAIRDDGGVITEERRWLMIKELGDIDWFRALIATIVLGVEPSVPAVLNVLKLRDRQKRNVIKGSGDNR